MTGQITLEHSNNLFTVTAIPPDSSNLTKPPLSAIRPRASPSSPSPGCLGSPQSTAKRHLPDQQRDRPPPPRQATPSPCPPERRLAGCTERSFARSCRDRRWLRKRRKLMWEAHRGWRAPRRPKSSRCRPRSPKAILDDSRLRERVAGLAVEVMSC